MEITSSSVSVYEVVLDLHQWRGLSTADLPDFVGALIAMMPSTVRHKCVTGEEGGFHHEMRAGTNIAHVGEHVLLELIHLADAEGREFSGWTRDQGDGSYRIHYGAPDFLSGRLAPILAVDIVRRLHRGETPRLDEYLAEMRDPLRYFTREHPELAGTVAAAGSDDAGLAVLDDLDTAPPAGAGTDADAPPPLADWQRDGLARIMAVVSPRLPDVHASWRAAFLAFGGEFAHGIVDKVEILNADRFTTPLLAGGADTYLTGVRGLCRMLRGLRIPVNFVTHAAWLYKNNLQLVALEMLADDPEAMATATANLDDLYQQVLHAIEVGYRDGRHAVCDAAEPAVRDFRARHVRPAGVLVVDDDAMARRAVRDILEYRGIPTVGAADGLSALRALAAGRRDISVVVLDLILPGMDGRAVCRRIRDSYPGVRIILSSGYPLDQETASCLADHEVCFLAKPFDSGRLVATVRDLLDLEHLHTPTLPDQGDG